MVKKTEKIQSPNFDKLFNEVQKKVVDNLKPELNKKIESLRSDILADFKEMIEKSNVPQPKVDTNQNLGSIMSMLKDGNVDLSKISQLISQPQNIMGSNGQPIDIDKLSEGQLKWMQFQQQNQMMMTVLPLILGQQTQRNPMINEMMNRIFLEKINSSIYMDKAMLQGMIKMMGSNMQVPQTNLTTPVSDAISGMTNNEKNPV